MRRTVLGLVFLALGLVFLAAALGPALLGLFAHPPVTATISLTPLGVGIVFSILGALMIDPSGTDGAMTTITVMLGNTSLPWVGGRRKDDPPAPPKDGA